jgi:uncharacterized damage-inducible protein DinB
LIDDITDKKTGLTEKEEFFLDILFDKHRGNIRAAMDAAGYPKDTPTRTVTKRLKDHIVEASRAYMSSNSAKAVISVVEVLDDPTMPGANTTLKAAKELLDRTGVQAPQEVTKIEARNIFILPAKEVVNED